MRLNLIRLEGIVEYYSTVLWHMKKETELAELAITAFGIDRHTASIWCAVGNCYSCQRDPDTALRYFKRATRVDPYNSYAHTLQHLIAFLILMSMAMIRGPCNSPALQNKN